MADGVVTESTNDGVKAELLKAAQDEISKVMNTAAENMTPMSKADFDASLPSLSVSRTTTSKPGDVGANELDGEYVEPMQDPYNKAIKYLENHNILQLFQQLTTSIVYTKPDQPLEFMMNEVERMKKEKQEENKK